jgi:hypothetical protein
LRNHANISLDLNPVSWTILALIGDRVVKTAEQSPLEPVESSLLGARILDHSDVPT